ncbi:hypothetical protein BG015_004168 [Linnemannia schmuckeri]|uniref:Uncharacterized protein n=1 Tax=Linnemannia schmuckeri TaxID=64567 RepID=A0A9P5S7I1_9FUNG|nr:hypothetical protein BG015_004168 [Linnemannia schmuckeri]
MKRAIKSFFGIKSKSKKDKDLLSENTRTSAVNSTLNPAADPHHRSSNSNRLSVIVHEGVSKRKHYDPRPTQDIIEVQQRLQASSASASAQSSTPLQPRPRQSEIVHTRTRTRSATSAIAALQPEQLDFQAARRHYFYQPQLIDRGAGIGGPASATRELFEGGSSKKPTQDRQTSMSQSTRATVAAGLQVVYSIGNPYQTYHCAARSSAPPTTVSLAQNRGYGTDPRQEAGPDDNDVPLSTGNFDDSHNLKLKHKAPIRDFGSLRSTSSTAVQTNFDGGDRLDDYDGEVDIDNKKNGQQDSAGVCVQSTPSHQQHNRYQNRQDREQDHGHEQGQRQGPLKAKVTQYHVPDLEQSLLPVSHPNLEPNPTSQVHSTKRFSLNSLISRTTFKRLDSGVEPSTSKKKTSSSKGKGTVRGNTRPDTSSNVSPRVRQFDVDIDQFMKDNAIPDLEKHPYRISLDYELRLQARAYAKRLAEERESEQVKATLLQQQHDYIATVPKNPVPKDPAPTILQEPTLATPQPRPLSIKPKGSPSVPILSVSDSPPSRTNFTEESKRLSNTTSRGTSRGTARRIIYSADLANGLPKGHIAHESNFKIVPTKRFSASSARTNNTSSRSYTTTHVMTTADNLDGVPSRPASAAASLIIRPETRGKSPRIINKHEFSNTFGPSSVIGSINSGDSSESEERSSEQFMAVHTHNNWAVDMNHFATATTKKRVEGRDTGPEQAMGEFLGHLSDVASAGPRAEQDAVHYGTERRLRMAKRPTVIPGQLTGQHIHADPQDIMSFWVRPARLRSLDVVLNRNDWLPSEDMNSSPSNSNTSIYSLYMSEITDREQSSHTPPTLPANGESGDETASSSLDNHSISNSMSTKPLGDPIPDSALIIETSSSTIAPQSSRSPPPMLINGLTAEELINSVRFESDCEGSLGFYGPREFERDQERRRKVAQAKKEQEKAAIKVAKAAKAAAAEAARDNRQGVGVGASLGERIGGIVSTLWSQMTQTTVTNIPHRQ